MVAWSVALGLAALLAGATAEDEIILATFDGATGSTHTWVQMNDPVMGGESRGTFSIDAASGLGIFDGEVVNVPFLKAPGFIKALTQDSSPEPLFPDISACQAIAITARASSNYTGYRVSVGNSHVPWGKFFAYGYKANFQPSVGEFGTTIIALKSFTDYWDDATGEAIKTCQDSWLYCINEATKRDLRTMSVWAEGVAGKIHLEIKEVKAVGCQAQAIIMM